MKFCFALAMLCSFLTTQIYSQEAVPVFETPTATESTPVIVKEQVDEEVFDEELAWKPNLHVFLNEPTGSLATLLSRKEHVYKSRTVYESSMENGRVVKVPRNVVEAVSVDVEVLTAGVTIIDCDAIDIDVKSSEEGKQSYAFEISGQLRLRTGSSSIKAESAKLSNGKLKLTEVTLVADGVSLSSSEVTLDLNVENLRIGEFGEPTTLPTPTRNQPTPFDHGARGDGFEPTIPSTPVKSPPKPFSAQIPSF